MFESRIIEAAGQRGALADGQTPDVALPLRELGWGELAARLSATRELRDVLAAASCTAGSFDVATAHQISGAIPGHRLENADGLPAINPDALGNRKYAGGKDSPDAAHKSSAHNGDRGNA